MTVTCPGVLTVASVCFFFRKATGISNEAKSILADETIVSIGRRLGRSAAQVVLRWLVQRQVVVIPKSTSAARLRENLQVVTVDKYNNSVTACDSSDSVFISYVIVDAKLTVS